MPFLRQATLLATLSLSMFAAFACSAADGLTGTPSTIVASQGGATVTLEDIDAFANGIPESQRGGFFNSPARIQTTISNLLVQKQLAADARKLGMDKEPLVQAQMHQAADEALGKARMQRFRTDLKVPDLDALAHEEYIGHKENYVTRGKLVVRHVLIGTKERSEADALKLAETVEKEARAHPDQFDALVERYSDDPSKGQNHGEMSDAGNSSKYLPPFVAAASKLKKVGEISPLVKTSYGYHILKLVDRTDDKTRAFSEVKPEIVARLRNEYIDKQVRTFADTMRNLPLDANPDLVASLRSRYDSKSTPAESTASK